MKVYRNKKTFILRQSVEWRHSTYPAENQSADRSHPSLWRRSGSGKSGTRRAWL